MIQILVNNPLLLLFIVAAIGYPLGRIKIGGTNLGVASVLFVGLAVGSLHPNLMLPEIIYQLGLVLFVYTIGLSSGGIFFASLRRKGLRDNGLAAAILVLAALLAFLVHRVFELRPTLTVGMFTGSLTNTPALAGVLEYIKGALSPELYARLSAEPVVAYSLTYPMGVIGMILVIYLLQKIWKVDYASEENILRDWGASRDPLLNRTVRITRREVNNRSIEELIKQNHWGIIFGRLKHGDEMILATGKTVLHLDDEVNLVGSQEELNEVVGRLGVLSDEHLEQDLSKYDKRRIFVSNPAVAGRRLRDLDLLNRYGAIVTRLRRGDSELLPRGDTVLALGDQVRVVAQPAQMEALCTLFGDSFRGVSEIDILTFSLGLAIGLMLGLTPLPLPNGLTLKLGLAGGPLIVALILGSLGRTGPMVWNIPYSANLALRQIGLILFLAGIGTRSGYAFVSTLGKGNGFLILAAGTGITVITALLTLFIGYRLLKIPMGLLIGMLAGLQTQPAVLGFAHEQTHNDLPDIGYAAVYPVATITKILLAQVLLILLMGSI